MFEINKLQQRISADEIMKQTKKTESSIEILNHIILEIQPLPGIHNELNRLRNVRNQLLNCQGQYVKLANELELVCDMYQRCEAAVVAECEKENVVLTSQA